MKLFIDGDVLLYIALATVPEGHHDPDFAAQTRYLEIYTDIREGCFVEDLDNVYLHVSGNTNFRKVHYPIYKSNRKSKPEGLDRLKEHVIGAYHNCIVAEGMEADDSLLIQAAEETEAGGDWIIATVDKDLRTHPGKFYDVRKNEFIYVTPNQAHTFMLQQFIMGDRVDGINGAPGMGPKKTAQIIHEENSYAENWNALQEFWADDPETFEETFNLAFIRRSQADCKPLEVAGLDYPTFRERIRVCIPDHEG